MEELVQRLVDRVGLDPDLSRRVTVIILNFINREGPPDDVKALFSKMPEAQQVLAEPVGVGPSGSEGGLFGGLGSLFGGGGAMAAFNELTAAGLGFGQVQEVTRTVIEFGREKAGEDTIGRIVGSIPGLSQFI
jgi:hypothetical protein